MKLSFADLKKRVGQGRISEVIDTLECESSIRKNEILSIQSRYYSVLKNERNGVASNEEISREKNRINLNLLELLDELQADCSAIDRSNSWDDSLVESYLEKERSKHQSINNFLHRDAKVSLWDVYYPLTATHGKETLDLSRIKDQLEEFRTISIVGTAGSGKTTLMKALLLKVIEDRVAMPIFVEFRKLRSNALTLEQYILERIIEFKLARSIEQSKIVLEQGNFVLLMDGFDEWKGNVDELYHQIERIIDKYPQYFILSSREESGIDIASNFHKFKIQDFTEDDVRRFIQKQLKHDQQEVFNSYLDRVKEENVWFEHADYRVQYLKKPLLLSMFLFTYQRKRSIPAERNRFYAQVFQTLWEEGDRLLKSRHQRSWAKELPFSTIIEILGYFSIQTVLKKQFSFHRSDCISLLERANKELSKEVESTLVLDALLNSSVLINAGGEYVFFHRSMQDYFAILFLSKCPTSEREQYFLQFQRMSFLGNHHFLSLLKEMESDGYYKFLMLPYLKKVTVDPTDLTDDEVIESFLKISDLQFGYELNADNSGIQFTMSNQHTSELTFFTVASQEISPPCSLNQGVVDQIKDILDQTSKYEDWMVSIEKIHETTDRLGLGEHYYKLFNMEEMRDYFSRLLLKIEEIEAS